MKSIKFFIALAFTAVIFSSCSSDDSNPELVNEEEVITDVTITLTDNTGNATTYTYTDPSYRTDSYVEPEIVLEKGKTYTASMNFYNNSDPSDPETITDEIKDEKDDHFLQFAFTGIDVSVARSDNDVIDDNGIKIGLITNWTGNATGEGSSTITLIHQPTTKDDTTDPKGSHTGGETDAEVTFKTKIE
ncbi:hypothetical protein ACG2LH_12745 [Zhouia sp. PK063]|uniref:hypothetical protein n=1 Tax=Zhouia sp. PK063 TaxID=3373602 RepID=UPI0037B9A87C